MASQRALSLSYYTVPELSFNEMIDVAASAGCQHVGARLLNGAPSEEPVELLKSAAVRREACMRMRDRGISALDASAARIRPATDVKLFTQFLTACEELGVRHAMCTIDDVDHDRALVNLALLCDMAKPHGVRIEIEFVPWMTVGSLGDAARMVREANRSNLGIAVDALHFDRSHARTEELLALPTSYFQYAQICDALKCIDYSTADQLRVATLERLFPGEGDIDLIGMLRALPAEIPLGLEIPTEALAKTVPAAQRVARAVATTRAVLQEAEKAVA